MSRDELFRPDVSRRDMSRPDGSTSVRPTTGTAARQRPFALHILSAQPSTYVVDRMLQIGRAATCDVPRTADDACSRVHLRLSPSDDGVQITDLRSSNGTFIDGVRVERATTVTSGVLRFGDTVAVIARMRDEDPPLASDCPLIGGTALAKARRVISLTARTELPLLIVGETGTGKEVAARWVHVLSRRSGPLVAINCAALPEALLEAELFGHVKGAFTGATHSRRGLVAAAAGGTLFLDEIGEMPIGVQAKLLRVLEDRRVRAIGAEHSQGDPVDFRVVSATNVDLQAAVARGAFRADLFARLDAVTVALPPLRMRIEDVPALIEHLLARSGADITVGPDALEAIARFAWPHNVRQLDYALRHAAALSAERIDLEHLPDEVQAEFRRGGARHEPPSQSTELTRDQLDAALQQHHGNVRKVGQKLGVPRSRLYRLLAKWQLRPDAYRIGTASASAGDPK